MKVLPRVMRGAKALKHSDRRNRGYPDMSVTWAGVTSWWEDKLFDEGPFKSPPAQRLLCRQLARQGICYYVIYALRGGIRTTHIVEPDELDQWETGVRLAEGFNHEWVARFVRLTHLRKGSRGVHS